MIDHSPRSLAFVTFEGLGSLGRRVRIVAPFEFSRVAPKDLYKDQ